MPVLRIPTDTSLGDTLSNLGRSLSENLNPMNMIRAQDIQAQVQQRLWEVQQQQRIDAANQNAAAVYRNANPFNEDPASLEVSANNIASGHADLGKSIDAVKAAGGWQANKKAADMYAAAHPELPPDQLASDQAELISGRKSASELASDRANAALGVNKATATISATTTARGATTGPQSDLAAEAAASGDTTGASKLIAQGNELTAPIITGSIESPDTQAEIDRRRTQQSIAGTTPPAGQPVSSGLRPQEAVADVTGKTIVAQAAPRAPGSIVPLVAPVDPLTGLPVGPGATTPAFSQPAQGPDIAATTATTTAEASSKAAADYSAAQLQDGISEGIAGRKVMNDIAQMRRLGDLMDNGGLMTQAENEIASRAYAAIGLTLTPGQTAREVFDTYKSAIMASWRKDEGIQRLALPEIQLGQISLPSARMSHDALNQSLDSIQARAMLGQKVGQSALKYWSKGATPENAAGFLTERDQIYDPANNPTNTIRQQRENQPPTTAPTLPALKPNGSGGWLHLQSDGSYR